MKSRRKHTHCMFLLFHCIVLFGVQGVVACCAAILVSETFIYHSYQDDASMAIIRVNSAYGTYFFRCSWHYSFVRFELSVISRSNQQIIATRGIISCVSRNGGSHEASTWSSPGSLCCLIAKASKRVFHLCLWQQTVAIFNLFPV